MITKQILINIPNGLEARPVALLVQVASQYECGKIGRASCRERV